MSDHSTLPDNNSQNRPRAITLLAILLFLASIFQFIKFGQALAEWSILSRLPLSVGPIYLAATGLFWGICGSILSWGLWTGKPWAKVACLVISLVYCGFFWFELIWIAEGEFLRSRWLVNLVLTIIALPGIWLILNQESTKRFFNRYAVK
jgi:hypothetical protein